MNQETKTEGNARARFYTFTRPVREVPEEERPRELFDRLGPENLSDKHLLALVLRSGVKGMSVIDLADGLLNEYGSLDALATASVDDLAAVRGMGRVRAQVVLAALELGRRLAMRGPSKAVAIRSPEDAANVLRAEAFAQDVENFWVLLLDRKYRLRRRPLLVTRGILDTSLVHPREVFKEAIRCSSAAVLVAHNHPSGDLQPSAEDIRITRQIVEAGRIVGIEVLDHLILGRPDESGRDYFSFRESGLVSFES